MSRRRLIIEGLFSAVGGLFLVSVFALSGPPTTEEVPTTVIGSVLSAQSLVDGVVPFWTSNLGFGVALPFSETFTYHPLVLLFAYLNPHAATAIILWVHGMLAIFFLPAPMP